MVAGRRGEKIEHTSCDVTIHHPLHLHSTNAFSIRTENIYQNGFHIITPCTTCTVSMGTIYMHTTLRCVQG